MKKIDGLALDYAFEKAPILRNPDLNTDFEGSHNYSVYDVEAAYKAGFMKARELASKLFIDTLNIRHTAGEHVLTIGEEEE